MDGLRNWTAWPISAFASVYRDFSEARDFEEFASNVRDIRR
jgi:transcriptional repressor NrdR